MGENDVVNFLPEDEKTLEEALAKRYSSKGSIAHEPVVYEFTTDRALLHQYYQLREHMYRKAFKTDKFVGQEDVYDKLSHILIARRGKLCVGGMRITVREADEVFDLPMETSGFSLKNALPELDLGMYRHAEISRFAILDSEEDKEILYNMCKVLYDKLLQLEVDYGFARCTKLMARSWKMFANKFGSIGTHVRDDINLPENPLHPDIQWYLNVFVSPYLPANAPVETVEAEANTRVLH